MPTSPLQARPALHTTTAPALLAERRSAMRGQRETRRQHIPAAFEFRANPDSASGPSFRFSGYAATFEQPFEMWDMWGDPYLETLAATACARTLANQADCQFLVGHDTAGIPMARTKSGTMTLTADSTGLQVSAPNLDGRNPQVQALASAMERGDMDEMSIGFIALAQQWSPDFMERRITEISLHRGDVSIVCWAANPNAAGATLTTALPVSEAAARAAGGGREARTPTAPYSAKGGEDAECPQCHSMNDPAAAYCDQCGTAVRATATQAAADEELTQRCSCGTWNADDAKFCSQCGQNIASDRDADNGGRGNGNADDTTSSWWDWNAQRQGGERRAMPADGEQPDFSGKPAHDPGAHGDGSPQCPNEACGAANAADAGYCDQCGTLLYDQGGLVASVGSMDDVVSDASGIVEIDQDEALADARARVRVLQLAARR
ncbi:HK97 family phage prohead protease [Streptacidiphilus rugosus]|uniref:HK97 family phage prohead protease n=1 Tax=Streptacidiphilus rugosus TaxID=405783 RepID=UPI0006915D2F|nr:HK97 family phage prohead protease [Streptacidiphilus rugosus]